MTGEARDGLQQEARRALLADLELRIVGAPSEEELVDVAARVQAELVRLPGDAALLRFRLEVDQQIAAHKDRRTVSDTAASCRKLLQADDLPAARECVHKALAQVPGNGQLLALAQRIEDRMRQETQESRRRTALLHANEALTHNNYTAAVEILMQCLADSYSQDVADLLQSSRDQLTESTRRRALGACHLAAQDAMRAEDYAAVIAAIEPVLQYDSDDTLVQMLDRARRAERERDAAMERLRAFVSEGLHGQVIAFAAALGRRVTALPEVAALTVRATKALEAEREHLRHLGGAYAVLASDDPSADWTPAPTNSPSVASKLALPMKMWTALGKRRETIANGVVRAQRALLRADRGSGNGATSAPEIRRIRLFANFASKDAAREWAALAGRRLPRVRQKLMRRVRSLLVKGVSQEPH